MQVDFHEFISAGRFGTLRFGSPWQEAQTLLGTPPLFEPESNSSPALARYGDVELAIHDGTLVTISLNIESDADVPAAVTLTNFEDPGLYLDELQTILAARGVSLKRLDELCDDWFDYYRTSTGVHLVLGGDALVKVSAADPSKRWGV